ncbi:hypothetical protein ACFQLX_13680 [Streptomyces polyrhachis]|uniref:Uncharacterized protein n=1 Tax=Streptomyces polyrhachis TaxID=1282885 RepID=A0ABW2GJH7_9ACTN
MRRHLPKGPNGSWKTGQRVPETGFWVDQNGLINHFEVGDTFPPTCTGFSRKSECAYRIRVEVAAQAS